MDFSVIAKLLGGIGLFLLGVELMRTGFKSAAGNSLRRILSEYTNSTLKSLFSGFLVSSAIQSAGAVAITIIGFVNAHILSLRQAVTIVFGANLGKIATAWIITSFGMKVDLGTYTLPLIGIGIFAKGILPRKYSGYMLAMVGFATIYLGLSFLKENIAYISEHIHLGEWLTDGHFGHAMFFVFGFILTVLTQSSSAALAIALSATSAGIIPVYNAADIIVGLNLGTTSNTYFASMKMSPNAKRLAFAHIFFNVICSVVGIALILLTFNFPVLTSFQTLIQRNPIDGLTLFYTVFILISMGIALPLQTRLVSWLKRHFFDASLLSSPSFIDPIKHRDAPPLLALEKLHQETVRFGEISCQLLRDTLEWNTKNGWVFSQDLAEKEAELDRLNEYLHQFAAKYISNAPESSVTRSMQSLCRAIQHFGQSSDLSDTACTFKNKLTDKLNDNTIELLTNWSASLDELIDQVLDILKSGQIDDLDAIQAKLEGIDHDRRNLRYLLVEDSIMARIKSTQASALIDIVETSRRSFGEIIRGTLRIWKNHETIEMLHHKILSSEGLNAVSAEDISIKVSPSPITQILDRKKI